MANWYEMGYQQGLSGKGEAGGSSVLDIGNTILKQVYAEKERKRKEEEDILKADRELKRKLKLEKAKENLKRESERLKEESKQAERARYGLDIPTETQIKPFLPRITEQGIPESTPGSPIVYGPGGRMITGKGEAIPGVAIPRPREDIAMPRFQQEIIEPTLKGIKARGLIPERSTTGGVTLKPPSKETTSEKKFKVDEEFRQDLSFATQAIESGKDTDQVLNKLKRKWINNPAIMRDLETYEFRIRELMQ